MGFVHIDNMSKTRKSTQILCSRILAAKDILINYLA